MKPPRNTAMHVRKTTKARPQARRAKTRAAILAAAGNIFAESGLAGARTDAIAAAAGVNKAMLYYYFKDKDRLYEAVIEDHFREFNAKSLAILNGTGPARAVLLQYVGLHFDFISERHRYACFSQHLMMADGKTLGRLVQKYFIPRTEALDKLLRRGMRSGEFRRADTLHTAISLVGLIMTYFSTAKVLQLLVDADLYGEASLRRRKQEVFNFVRYGLFLDPEAAIP